jgi:hypothetical protein
MDHPNIAKVLDAGRYGDWPAVLRHGLVSVPITAVRDKKHVSASG